MGKRWARAFPGAYVVELTDIDARERMIDSFAEAIKLSPVLNGILLLVSPLMPANIGRYNGLLPKDLWAQINGTGR
jgi:hypothetical protein